MRVAIGDHVRRYLPQLRNLRGPVVHQLWKLDAPRRGRLDHAEPIIDLREGADRFHTARKNNEGKS